METVRNFSKSQVADVKSMGFGSILDMNLNRISTCLGFWLVRNFDEEFDELSIGNHQIKITSDSVYEDSSYMNKGQTNHPRMESSSENT
ncbi:hypothetical protein Hanom_Chr05g00411551 [Helianthus anomalus]